MAEHRMLHELTFPEVLASKVAVCDLQGYLMGGPDRQGANAINPVTLFVTWQQNVQAAAGSGRTVPEAVTAYFAATKHLTRPPEAGKVIDITPKAGPAAQDVSLAESLGMVPGATPPPAGRKLANPPRFTWSYTAVQEFLTCPYQYAAKRYFKTIKEAPSAAMLEGQRVHKAFENAILEKPTKEDLEVLARVKGEKYVAAFLGARAKGATVMAEQQMALDRDLNPCDWFDPRGGTPKVYGRGVLDVGILSGDTFKIYDFKTGKLKDDQLQLRIFCAFVAQHYPQVQHFDAKFIWLKDDKVTGLDKPITRADIPGIWAEVLAVVNRMEQAWDSEVFRRQTNGLCRNWCLATDCPHCGGK